MSSAEVPADPTDTSGRWYNDPAARNYLFVGLASLLIVAAVLFFRQGHPLSSTPVIIAVLGLVLRSPLIPGLFLVLLCLASIPWSAWLNLGVASDIQYSHFRLMDIVLVGAMLIYIASHYRLMSLTTQGMPSDIPPGQPKKGDKPPRRPGATVPHEELGKLFATIGACVIVGQIVWAVVSTFQIELGSFPPLRLPVKDDTSQYQRWFVEPDWPTRFFTLCGLTSVALIPLAILFWYWRVSRLNPAESRMVLLDTSWRESRREYNRQEKWRAWGLTRHRSRQRKRQRPFPVERPRVRGPRRSFFEALTVTCGMVFVGIIVAVVAVIILDRLLLR